MNYVLHDPRYPNPNLEALPVRYVRCTELVEYRRLVLYKLRCNATVAGSDFVRLLESRLRVVSNIKFWDRRKLRSQWTRDSLSLSDNLQLQAAPQRHTCLASWSNRLLPCLLLTADIGALDKSPTLRVCEPCARLAVKPGWRVPAQLNHLSS